ncbi:MAG: metalloregulator ArsR/SmtB family transcription factor [bacterium]|nr:metalloregulator ArsR/SmtB family transcription factor [bacterium]
MTSTTYHAPFKGLADPTRLRIAIVMYDCELCVCDLTAILELPQPTISRHMSNLRIAGLVEDRRDGRWVHYRLSETPLLQDLRAYFELLAREEPYRSDRERLRLRQKEGKC